MKLLFTLVTLILICCNDKDSATIPAPVTDTVYIKMPETMTVTDTCRVDSLQVVIDSLRRKLFVSDYKIQRVKYYLGITIKNPSQTKYLKGWIKRAVE